jgi:hypothetical protein
MPCRQLKDLCIRPVSHVRGRLRRQVGSPVLTEKPVVLQPGGIDVITIRAQASCPQPPSAMSAYLDARSFPAERVGLHFHSLRQRPFQNGLQRSCAPGEKHYGGLFAGSTSAPHTYWAGRKHSPDALFLQTSVLSANDTVLGKPQKTGASHAIPYPRF